MLQKDGKSEYAGIPIFKGKNSWHQLIRYVVFSIVLVRHPQLTIGQLLQEVDEAINQGEEEKDRFKIT